MKFKEGKIVEIFYAEKKGKRVPIIIRYPRKNDVRGAWKFYNKVIKETENLNRIRPVSLKDERTWVRDSISKVKKNNMMLLYAECDGRIVGSASIERHTEDRKKHVASFGVAILHEFTGMGLGTRMMTVLEKNMMAGIKLLVLDVYGKNNIAQHLYKKMGFKTVGKIPCSVKTSAGYQTDIIMYKVLK